MKWQRAQEYVAIFQILLICGYDVLLNLKREAPRSLGYLFLGLGFREGRACTSTSISLEVNLA
jgi:hypothetical protein